jgi:transposase
MSMVATGVPTGTRIWLAAGTTDMRKGFTGLSALVQNALTSSPFCGHIFVFRGRRGDLLKVLWWDGTGLCLMAKRLDAVASSGHKRRAGVYRSVPRNCRCCSRESIGGIRCARLVR